MTEQERLDRLDYLHDMIPWVGMINPEQAEAMELEFQIHWDNVLHVIGKEIDIAA
jgi:hypothetical protein